MRISVLCLGLAIALGSGQARGRQAVAPAPADLGQSGLYSDYAAKTVDSRNLAYTPQYPLWSDGASKRRWIYLPPGTSIDASDPDVWAFPVGTKAWKEFSFHGRRVETRVMEKIAADEWRFAAYAWNRDESAAALVPSGGLKNVAEIEPELRHDIPSVFDCQACHVNARTEILGFSALQLSSDRDPAAPHAEPVAAGMVTLDTLIEKGLIRSFPPQWRKQPPRIEAPTPAARAALGYLHANCGNCHNPAGSLSVANLLLRHSVAPGTGTEPALRTAVDKRGRSRIPGVAPDETFLIRSGDPNHSTVLYRMATRDSFRQMPPLGTKLVDADAVALIRRWIQNGLAGANSTPGQE